MSREIRISEEVCKTDAQLYTSYRRKLSSVAEDIIESCDDRECYIHVDYEPIPSRDSVIDIISRFKTIVFPGYFSQEKLDPVNLKYHMGQTISDLFDMLSLQINHSIRHDCFRYNKPCNIDCDEQVYNKALDLLESVPVIRQTLATDVRATFEGDPAAKSHDEVIFSYPGLFAIMVYRIAHHLYLQDVPLLPRIMTEYAHSVTGIDINPGAKIGNSFVIDHGTGVVIGETTVIGERVRLYQGVTLGALSLPKSEVEDLRQRKRHPTIEDDVIIYSGATILGGDTVIGARSVIGGNVWLTESVPADTRVMVENPRLVYLKAGKP